MQLSHIQPTANIYLMLYELLVSLHMQARLALARGKGLLQPERLASLQLPLLLGSLHLHLHPHS